jgi:hypothetical protein
MKRIFAVVLLTTILTSCQKDHSSEPSTPSTGQLTSLWTYTPGLQLLQIDSLEYDDQQKLARLRIYSLPGVTEMSIPKQFNDSTDSAVYTFAYQGLDSLPSSYMVTAKTADGSFENERHVITYDGQGRITADSVPGVTGNDIDGYTPTFGSVRKVHYSYNGSNFTSTQYYSDASVMVDSMWINDGNITERHKWLFNADFPDGSLFFKIAENTYSAIDNPFFKNKLFIDYYVGAGLFNIETLMPESKKLVTGNTFSTPYQSPTENTHMSIQWTTDSKGRVVSGEYTDKNDPTSVFNLSKYLFRYK